MAFATSGHENRNGPGSDSGAGCLLAQKRYYGRCSKIAREGLGMSAIIPVICGAIVTGIIGNYLVQRWQFSNWKIQQSTLAAQEELNAIKALIQEIAEKTTMRHVAMRKLLRAIAGNSAFDFDDSLKEYQSQVDLWNSSLNPLYVRIRMMVGFDFTIRFERDVHEFFVAAGRKIQVAVSSHRSGKKLTWSHIADASNALDRLQGSLLRYLYDITDVIEVRRNRIFDGVTIGYAPDVLQHYSLVDLVKALFVREVDEFNIVRPSLPPS